MSKSASGFGTFRKDALNLPNMLTYLRVLLVPLVLFFLHRGTKRDGAYAALAYAIAGITDLLDGYLARRLGAVSVTGKMLDPLADKLMVMATLVWLVAMARVPAFIVILVLARELAVTALRSIALTEGLVLSAQEGGKQKMALQVVGILCLVLGYTYRVDLGVIDLGVLDMVRVGRALLYLSLVMSFTSAIQYVFTFARALEHKQA